MGSNGFYSHWTFPAFLTSQVDMGVTRIAFHHLPAHLWLDHYRCTGLDTFRRLLAAAGVTVGAFHPGRYHYSLFTPLDTVQGRFTQAYLSRCLETATQLNCQLLCLRPAGALKDSDPKQAQRSLIQQLTELCSQAGDLGVTVCLQTVTPEEGAALQTLAQLSAVLEQIPALSAALDTLPMSMAGESISQWFHQLGSRIGYVCFQDGRSSGGCIWGEGVFPGESYAQQLREAGYQGALSISGCTDRYQADPSAADRQGRYRALALLSGTEEGSI